MLFKESILDAKSQDKLPRSTAVHRDRKATSNLESEMSIDATFSTDNNVEVKITAPNSESNSTDIGANR
jgi:hypothetical protein